MGGSGSGWQGAKKSTTENSLCLSMSALLGKKALVPRRWTSGSWGWTYEGEERSHANIGYEASLSDHQDAWLRLHYTANGEAVDYKIRLTTTTPNYGGLRWWFICPLVRKDGLPASRVAKLYLPPGGRYFGSRLGYGLTYTSCQQSRRFSGLYRMLAEELGTDEASIRLALKQG